MRHYTLKLYYLEFIELSDNSNFGTFKSSVEVNFRTLYLWLKDYPQNFCKYWPFSFMVKNDEK